jgi:hypothetical protein
MTLGKPWLSPRNSTFHQTVVNSPEWQAWVEVQEKEMKWDVWESIETRWLSPGHFAAFLEWVRQEEREKCRLLKCPCNCDIFMDEEGYEEKHGAGGTVIMSGDTSDNLLNPQPKITTN